MVFMPPLLEKQNKTVQITNLILFSSVLPIGPLGLSSGKFWRSCPWFRSVVRGEDSPSDLKFEIYYYKKYFKVQNLHKYYD